MGLNRKAMGVGAIDCELKIKKLKSDDIIVAFAGNPNVGKSTLFNALTGMKQHTGNWTGKTVTSACGYSSSNGQGYVMVDLPGCYSLMSHSKEEEVAEEFISSGIADVVVIVCDAVCLERNLGLVLQILDRTSGAAVCVNLMDEAAKKHIKIDLKKLEEHLGVPVIGTAARNGVGIDRIYHIIDEAAEKKGADLPEKCQDKKLPVQNKKIEKKNAAKYIREAEAICRDAVRIENEDYAEPDRKKDRIFTGKYTGFPIMLLLLMGIFWLTIVGANYPSQLLQRVLFGIEEKLIFVSIRLGVPVILQELFIHGMYRVTAWVVSVMLPPMAIFFPLFTILEDSGYLPRVAFNMDKCFQRCRACGKQSLTMCIEIVSL